MEAMLTKLHAPRPEILQLSKLDIFDHLFRQVFVCLLCID